MKKCKWTYDEDYNVHETDCGASFQIIEGTPKENNMKYCTYCGKEIKE